MKIIQIINKGQLMYTTEKYHVFKADKEGMKLKDTFMNNNCQIYETIHNYYQKTQQQHLGTPTDTSYSSIPYPKAGVLKLVLRSTTVLFSHRIVLFNVFISGGSFGGCFMPVLPGEK
jgi:hypothetical protein